MRWANGDRPEGREDLEREGGRREEERGREEKKGRTLGRRGEGRKEKRREGETKMKVSQGVQLCGSRLSTPP